MKNLFSLREEEIFKTLTNLGECDFVVIGGYAVNSYTLPRFSVDCDIVIRDEMELKMVEKILLRIGYQQARTPINSSYFGHFFRYEKEIDRQFRVSMDIMVNTVSDRMTGASFSAAWIFENSQVKVLKGKTIAEELKLRIIHIDALLVMKLISCRGTDIRDVFMMFPQVEHKVWVQSEVSARYNLPERLTKVLEKVDSKQFKDGLSGVYGKIDEKTFERHRKAILSLLDA